MNVLRWMRKRLALVVTVTSGGLVAILVATVALISQGYHRQEVNLDDASVWVVNSAEQLIGHANTEIAKLDTAMPVNGSELSLMQDPTHLVVHDRGNNTLDIVNPADATLAATVPLPTGVPEVVGAGSKVLIYLPESGDAWVSGIDDLAAFDAKSSALMSLGVNAVLTADENGRYLGYSMKSKQLVTGSLAGSEGSETKKVSFAKPAKKVQATLIGGKPVLYNPNSNELWVNGTLVSLSEYVSKPASAALMQPSTDGKRVLLAHDGGLVSIPLDSLSATAIGQRGNGVASAPVRVNGCDYAAWSSGFAYRMCGSGDPKEMKLDSATAGASITLHVNGQTVVANDEANGNTWAITKNAELIDNWGDFIDDTKKVEDEEEDRDVPPELDPQQKPPLAVDDDRGIRANRANTLSVLLNDSDPNGDALIIRSVSSVPAEFGRVDIVNDAQQLQFTSRENATGSLSFTYTVSDGHGNEATAQVTVTVIAADVNTAPQQERPTRTSVASRGKATVNVLTDWVDPESDPIYLAAAVAAAPDRANSTPNGQVEFVDSGSKGDLKRVALRVSDGTDEGEGTLTVTVGAVGTVPIIAESFAVVGYTGQPLKVEPLPNVRGGTGTITLNGAAAATGDESLRITPDYTNGIFSVVTDKPGTHYIEYSVTDGEQTASGTVRLEVASPPDDKLPPVTMPTTAFLYLQNTQLVDVLATAYDPAGGVLNIVSVNGIPGNSGIVVEVVEQRILRVTLKKALEKGPVTFTYTVTNGHSEAPGSVTLVQIPEPTKLQAPVANPDSVTVRVGSVVDIPVMANDRQPDGKPLLLSSTLVKDAARGTLFVDGSKLRYLAPSKPGEYSAEYMISSTDGQWATATVTITVRDIDKANNRAPAAKTIVARVSAGQKVTILIPLAGIDPDGDTVEFVGQASSPQLGAISGSTPTSIEYTAGPYSTGTDSFQYTVIDSLGAVGTGTIRIGVSASTGVSSPPVAMDDLITTRPGAKLTIAVTDNDSDPDQGTLTISSIEPSDGGISARFTSDQITLTAPEREGSYGILYTIQNPRGGTSSAWLFIQVDKNAPLIRPSAADIVLTLQDIDGRDKVDVDVLKGVRFSEGTRKDLTVSVPEITGVSVVDNAAVRVEVPKKSRIIPFTVARVDDPTVTSTAFIWIPGTEDARPEIRRDAPKLTIPSGEKLTIDINDQVTAANGKKVTITDASTVSATFSDGSDLAAGDAKITYTSAKGYWGPASVTFTVTDGSNEATITLPITVTPKDNQPPVFNGASVPLEAGAETVINLAALTDYPYSNPEDKLTFGAQTGSKNTVNATVAGTKLTIRAVDGVKAGTTAKIAISVKDDHAEGKSGVITVTIVKSTRPLVSAIPDSIIIKRGDSKSIDVLDNDDATNPFPGRPLRVVSVDTSSLPSGVTVNPSADKSTLTIAVSKDGPTGDITFSYIVTDITGDPSRYSAGTVSVRIQDVPDAPPAAPSVRSQDNAKATVTLAIPHAFPNYSDVTTYFVTDAADTVMAECKNPDACLIEGLTYGQAYQFRAYAVNGVGEGKPSALSASVVVDLTPNPPADVTLVATANDPDGDSMRASWSNAGQISSGSPIEAFDIVFTGPGVNRTLTADGSATSIDIVDDSIDPGGKYTVSIRARNQTKSSEPGTAVGVAVGPPSIKNVYVNPIAPNGNYSMRVTWDTEEANGGTSLTFHVAEASGSDNDNGTCDPSIVDFPDSSGWVDGDPGPNPRYTVSVYNGLHCRTFVSAPYKAPTVRSANAYVPNAVPAVGTGTLDIHLDNLSANGVVNHYEYSLVNSGEQPGAWVTVPGDGIIVDANAYGIPKKIFVRACGIGHQSSCGTPWEVQNELIPLRVYASVTSCTRDGQPPVIAAPWNNNVPATVDVRYYYVAANGTETVAIDWSAASTPAPVAAPPGSHVEIETRVTINGNTYENKTPKTTCA